MVAKLPPSSRPTSAVVHELKSITWDMVHESICLSAVRLVCTAFECHFGVSLLTLDKVILLILDLELILLQWLCAVLQRDRACTSNA